jgi:AcrR family transcriptional regulator
VIVTTAAGPGTARRARTDRTRAAILAAARDVFVERGYRPTSLREIASAAGISHPGLLRHFATKDELLAAVVASLERDNAEYLLGRAAADDPGPLEYGAMARRIGSVPGYLELYAALTGEASTPLHPAHAIMRSRYARLIALSTDIMEEAIEDGLVAADRDARDEAIRLAAAWDGLQLLTQYLPERVDVGAALDAREDLLGLPRGWRDAGDRPRHGPPASFVALPDFGASAPPAEAGYRVGRDRRARIVADAMALFARDGYGDTSLQSIARAVGVSKSTLLHHYPSKEALLSAVLAERDRGIRLLETSPAPQRAGDVLRGIPQGAAHSARTAPGLIEVYAILSCEAAPAGHPAHAYFTGRFENILDHFTALLRAAHADGDLAAHRDPAFEALWLVALWDGLQYQWLYDPESVDVAAHLAGHLEDLLPQA